MFFAHDLAVFREKIDAIALMELLEREKLASFIKQIVADAKHVWVKDPAPAVAKQACCLLGFFA
jgi:hypothetical protein